MKMGAIPEKPEELRPIVHGQIDQLNSDDLPLVHRVLLQLKAERLAENIVNGFAKDDGEIFQKLEETIAGFRKQNPY